MANYTIKVSNRSGALIGDPTNAPVITSSAVSATSVKLIETGNGLTGGPITAIGTIEVLANTGIYANSSGLFANSTYISTLTVNSAIYLGTANLQNIQTFITSNADAAYTNAAAYVDGKSYVNTSQLSSNLANYQTSAGLAANVATLSANSSTFLETANLQNIQTFITSNADAAYTNAVSYVDGKAYVNTSQLSSNLANYQTSAGLSANVATLTSNNASFAYGKSEINLNVNNALTANSSTFLGTANLQNIQTFITSNAGAAYSNAVSYVDGKAYVNTSQLSSNLANYQTSAGLAANVALLAANSAGFLGNSTGTIVNISSWIATNSATAYTNAVSYVDGKSYVNTSQLSSNLANYQTTVGLASNVAVLTSNNATFAYSKTQINLNVNNALTANSSTFLGTANLQNIQTFITTNASAAYSNAVAYVDGKAYVNTSQLSSNLANYQTTAGLSANMAVRAANSSTYANASISNTFTIGTSTYYVSSGNVGIGTSAPNTKLDVAGPIRSYNSKFANGATGTNLILRTNEVIGEVSSLTFYSTFASTADVGPRRSADITSGYNTGIWGNEYLSFNVGTGGQNDNANTTLERVRITGTGNVGIGNTAPDARLTVTGTANVSGNVVIGGITTHNANVILGSSGLSANGGFGTAGQLLNSNGTATYWASDKATNAYSNAVSYVDGKAYVNTSQLSSNLANYALLTGATFSGNVRTQQSAQVDGNLVVSGNLTVSGNVTVIGANNLSVVDNMIYLNSNSTVSNPDLGFAGNYNDGVYRHTGFFRDASDGVWKVFDSYLPEPDASPYIDTTNNSFKIANFQANVVYVGNTTVYSTINTTSFSGTANNTTNAFGKTEINLNVNNALTANSSTFLGTANLSNIQTFITSNAAAAYTNAVSYVDGKSYVNTSQLSSNLANYQTTAGLASNVATLASNSATYANASISNTFTVGTSTYFVSNGNVGVGTNAPAGLLHLKSIGPIELILEADSDNILESDNPRILMKQDGGAVVGRIGYANNTNNLEVINEHPGSLNLGTANTIRVTADDGGNVGIGTLAPDARLAVSGTANISGNVTIGSTLTSANLIVSNLATVGSNVQIGTNGLVLGNSTVNTVFLSGILSFSRTNGANNARADLSTVPTGVAYLELGGSAGSYIDFKVPFSDDFDQRIEANNSSISIIGGSSTSAANNILLLAANVGIGNTAPDARLAVTGTANISGNMTIGGSLITTNVVTIGTSTYFVSNGNAGFGTNSPGYKVSINGGALGSTLGSTANAFQIYSTTGNVDYINFSKVREAVGSDWTTAAWRIQQVVDVTPQGYIQFNGNGNPQGLIFGTQNAERVRIDSSGNIGIGNTAPNAKLAVTGTANVSGNVAIGGTLTTQSFVANTLGLYNTGTINAASYTVGTSFIANTTTLYHTGTIYSNNLLFQGDGTNAYIRTTTGVLYLGTGSTNYFAVTAAGGGSFIPTTDNLYNLGSSTNRWANIYTGDLQLSNEGSEGNDIDQTTGSWTIQEGHENLYLINRKTGKKYMFVLKEV